MNRAKWHFSTRGVTGDRSEINSLIMIIHRNVSLVGNVSILYVSHNKKIHRGATANPG